MAEVLASLNGIGKITWTGSGALVWVPQILYGGSRESGRDATESIYQLPKFKSRNKAH